MNCFKCYKPAEHKEDYEGVKIYICTEGHRTGQITDDGWIVTGHHKPILDLQLEMLKHVPSFWDEQK